MRRRRIISVIIIIKNNNNSNNHRRHQINPDQSHVPGVTRQELLFACAFRTAKLKKES